MTTRKPDTRGQQSPLVEAVTKHKGQWQIFHSEDIARTDNSAHKMWVPLDDETCDQCGGSHNDFMRAHELLHAKLSPEERRPVKVKVGKGKPILVSEKNLEMAEEYRINHSLIRLEGAEALRAGFCYPLIETGINALLDQAKYEDVVRVALSAPMLRDEVAEVITRYQQHLNDQWAELEASKGELAKPQLERLQRKIALMAALVDAIYDYSQVARRIMTERLRKRRTLPQWSRTQKLAAFYQANFADFPNKVNSILNPKPAEDDLKRIFGAMGEGAGLSPSTMEVKKSGSTIEFKPYGGDSVVRWGKVTKGVTTAPLVRALPAWKLQKANRAVEEGTIPRYMHRWPSDKRVFHRTRRLEGASILIDDSGSMGLTPEDLDKMLETAPAATVAVYAGVDHGDGGEIRIVAKNGKRAAVDDLSIENYGGNGIDGPALEWLGEQSYPRIWITDGHVIPKIGNWEVAKKDAAELCVKHKVTVVYNAEEAADRMKRKDFAR